MNKINVSEGNAIVLNDIYQQDKEKKLFTTLDTMSVGILTFTGRKNLDNRLDSHIPEEGIFNLYKSDFSYIVSVKSEKDLISIIKSIDIFMSKQDMPGCDLGISLIIDGIEKVGDEYILVGAMFGRKVEGEKVIEALNIILEREKNNKG